MTWTENLRMSFAAFMVVTLPVVVHTQGETIPQAVARGASGRVRTAPSGRPPAIPDLLRETDIMVRGTVGEPRNYLSDDQRDVYTDYPIENLIFLYQAQMISSTRAGVTPTVTVTQLGGTVTVGGQIFTQTEEGLPPLQAGTEGVFLLKRVDEHYRIVGTFFGAFGISGGKLTPLTKVHSFAPEYRDAQATQAVEEILMRLRALRGGR